VWTGRRCRSSGSRRPDHRRLVDRFQQHHEVDLPDRVYVELAMAPDRQAELIEQAGERDLVPGLDTR
jgi:hypothetical protein